MLTEEALRGKIRALVRGYPSQKRAAQHWGISQQYLNDVLHGRRAPGPQLLSALGYERVVLYRSQSED